MLDDFNFETMLVSTFFMLYVLHGFTVFVKDYRAYLADNLAELRRPWKLATLAVGTAWLLYGAIFYHIDDWDVGVSLIMASLTYVASPWCARALVRRRWDLAAGVIVTCWFCVDGSYNLWHNLVGNQTFRVANFPASMSLFWLCGFIWLPCGSLREIVAFRGELLRRHGSPK